METTTMTQRVLLLAAVLAGFAVLPVYATEPKDQWPPNPRLTAAVKGDRGMAKTPAPASDPRKRYFVVLGTGAEPDFPGAGASVEARWKNRRLVRIPPEAVDGIARHPGVKYLQRIKERDGTALGAPEPLRAAPAATSVGEVLTAWTTGYYAFDAVGNITSIGPDTWGRTQSYEYDGVNRITRGTAHTRGQTHEQTYKYDPYGNLTEIRTDGAYESIPPVDHATNRLEGVTYDDAGNLTGDGVDAYSWDGGSMMKELDSPGARQVGYVYTAGDERIGIAHGPEMYWTWTLRDDSGKVVREYESVLGLNGSACFWVEDTVHGAGRILKQERDPAEGGGRTIHADHLGSTRMVTTDDGYKVTEHQYYPFGIEASSMLQENAVGFDRETRPKFTGHERDYLGGHWVENRSYLDYMHARSYNPNLGRFLSPDPVLGTPSQPQTWNRYSYVANNPLKFIDPTGENAQVACDADKQCTATVEAQIEADPNDPAQMAAAVDFRNGAVNYWQGYQGPGPNGENITVQLNMSIVAPGQTADGVDTLTVVPGSGTTNVQMSLLIGSESTPDTGTIFTNDATNNPSGMAGIAPHEVGHLMGLRDMYVRGQAVPLNASPSADLMRHAQPTNSPLTLRWVMSPANGNSVVQRQMGPPLRCMTGPC